MAISDCLAEIEKAVGRKLSDDELDDLFTELDRRAKRKQAEAQAADLNAAILEAADEYARDLAQEAVIQKRNAAINLKTRLQLIDYVMTQFPDNPVQGLEAILVGVNRAQAGARFSAAAVQKEIGRKYLAGLRADLFKDPDQDLWPIFASGAMDREVARALYARNRDDPSPVDVPQQAIEIADAVAKWNEIARQDANKAGAWIKRMEGYIVRQSHDMYAIRRAGYETWRDEILPRLDWERTLGEAPDTDPEQFLQAVYDAISNGLHLKTQPHPGFTGTRNIAKRASAERVLHFKSADDWFDYNQRFGSRSLKDAVVNGLDLAGQNTGLMRTLGTNPENNLRQIADTLKRRVSADQAGSLDRALQPMGRLANQLAVLDGTTRMPVNHILARIAGSVRAINNMAKLGLSVFSQFSDLTFHGSTMSHAGDNYLSAMRDGLTGMGRGFSNRDRAHLHSMTGVFADGMRGGNLMSRHSVGMDDMPGSLSWLQQLFFKANFMMPWTDRLRAAAVDGLAHLLALNRNTRWGALNRDLQRTLNTYAIAEPEWNIIRKGATRAVDDQDYVVPEALFDLPDDDFVAILQSRGVKATQRRVADLKEEIASKLRAFYVDRGDIAVSIPDARVRAAMTQGSRPGTLLGEFTRFVGQFKSFAVGVVYNHLGREFYGRGANTFAEALRSGNGELLALGRMMGLGMLFGYVSMSAKDLAKGREPRDPFDWRTAGAAFVQGGGAGIYGDFLFGEYRNRYGQNFITTLAGPAAGTVNDLADLYGRALEGDDTASQAMRVVMNNTPYANLFYSRIALDYLFLWNLQEAVNPGSLRRMEQRIERENAQTFLVRPSEMAR